VRDFSENSTLATWLVNVKCLGVLGSKAEVNG